MSWNKLEFLGIPRTLGIHFARADYPGVFRIWHRSPALPYGSPYLLDKIIFWAFLCLSLRFSPFLAQHANFSYSQLAVSGAFLDIFIHWQRLFLASKWCLQILIVCNSCKTSNNVLSHSHWGLGQSVGGWGHWNPGGGGAVGGEKKRASRF